MDTSGLNMNPPVDAPMSIFSVQPLGVTNAAGEA